MMVAVVLERPMACYSVEWLLAEHAEGLEGADEFISLRRAGELSGLSPATLRRQAYDGKLQTKALGPRMLVTTRRWLHAYLAEASKRDKGARKPLPEGYVAPD
jgi:hypothetical protein